MRETLKRTPILRPALVILAFVVILAAGYLWGEWAGGHDLSGRTAELERELGVWRAADDLRMKQAQSEPESLTGCLSRSANNEKLDCTRPIDGTTLTAGAPRDGSPSSDKR